MSLTELPAPRPRAGEVLVELRATSLNLSDWEFLRGTPAYVRLWGLRRPRYRILGSDIAGRVVEVGPGVSKFRVGAEVFGDVQGSWGGFAELVCAHENMLTLKPESLSFEQVAAIPQAALVALQGLRRGGIAPGQRVLINGAGGGSGSFAVQIAKSFGAIVTGVDSAAKLESMRAVGADAVIDYAVADFAELGERYDLILDLAASRSLFEVRRALSPRGRYVLAGGSLGCLLQALLLGPLLSLFSGKKLAFALRRAQPPRRPIFHPRFGRVRKASADHRSPVSAERGRRGAALPRRRARSRQGSDHDVTAGLMVFWWAPETRPRTSARGAVPGATASPLSSAG